MICMKRVQFLTQVAIHSNPAPMVAWWLGPVSFMWIGSPSYTFPKFIG